MSIDQNIDHLFQPKLAFFLDWNLPSKKAVVCPPKKNIFFGGKLEVFANSRVIRDEGEYSTSMAIQGIPNRYQAV